MNESPQQTATLPPPTPDPLPAITISGWEHNEKPYANIYVPRVRIEQPPLFPGMAPFVHDKQHLCVGTDFSGKVTLTAELRVLVLLAEAILKHAKEATA